MEFHKLPSCRFWRFLCLLDSCRTFSSLRAGSSFVGHTLGTGNTLHGEYTEGGILQWQFALFYISDFQFSLSNRVTNHTPWISAPIFHSSINSDTADQMCYSWRGKQSPLPVAGVDVSLCLPFPFRTISLLLACGSADSACTWADAAWSSRVALSCRVPIGTTTARHWKRKRKKKGKTMSAQLNMHLACFIATNAAELYFGITVLRRRCLWLSS